MTYESDRIGYEAEHYLSFEIKDTIPQDSCILVQVPTECSYNAADPTGSTSVTVHGTALSGFSVSNTGNQINITGVFTSALAPVSGQTIDITLSDVLSSVTLLEVTESYEVTIYDSSDRKINFADYNMTTVFNEPGTVTVDSFTLSTAVADEEFSMTLDLSIIIPLDDDGLYLGVIYPEEIEPADSLPTNCTTFTNFTADPYCTHDAGEREITAHEINDMEFGIELGTWFTMPLGVKTTTWTIRGYYNNTDIQAWFNEEFEIESVAGSMTIVTATRGVEEIGETTDYTLTFTPDHRIPDG